MIDDAQTKRRKWKFRKIEMSKFLIYRILLKLKFKKTKK